MTRYDFLAQFLKDFKQSDLARVLDIGNLDKKARLHTELVRDFPACEFFGLDSQDPKSLNLNLPNQHVGTFEKMPFADNYFDLVYMGQVLEHTWTPMIVLQECRRVLKVGGRLVLDLPNVYSLSRILRYTVQGREDLLGNSDHKIFYSPLQLMNMLEQAKFGNIFVDTERVFSAKITFTLPSIGPLKKLGESLIATATKSL